MASAMGLLTMNAALVDQSAASQTASQFLNHHTGRLLKAAPTSGAPRLVHVETASENPAWPLYYVYNTDDCFVVVAGDDRAEAVLAYGDAPLDLADVPCNLQALLDHYSEQVEWLHSHADAHVNRAPAPAGTATVIDPLLSCTWSQGTPYFDQCPTVRGQHCATGCIATAMAQVMYYWKYPDELPDLPAYVSRAYQIYVPELPGTRLDWDNMLDAYRQYYYNPAQGEAVATLMRYCGQGAFMDYGTDGSGAGCWNQLVAMQVFGYDLTAQLLHRDDYDTDAWNALMLEDLNDGYPILYTGYGDDVGHAFVVDGFDGSMYHINWGWEGSGNGYFALDAFDVGEMSFSWNQEMQYRLCPEHYAGPYDFEVDGVCYLKNGNEATVTYRSQVFNSYDGNVTIPNQVTSDGVTYTVTAISNNAFRDSPGLLSVTLPTTLRRIGKYAFLNCVNLTSVALPASVREVDYAAFRNCTSLTSLSLGAGVEHIGYYAFAGCSALKRLSVPGNVDTLDVASFISCNSLTSVTVGNGTTVVGDAAFAYCGNLRDVTLGDSVLLIGDAAFYECSNLNKVTLGLNLDSIGPRVFSGCTSLSKLIALPEVPPFVADAGTFDESNYSNTTLVVRAFAMDNYICDDIWTDFEHLACLEDEILPGDVNNDGEVNIADVNAVIDAILMGIGDSVMDVNGDGEVNIADVNAVMDKIV